MIDLKFHKQKQRKIARLYITTSIISIVLICIALSVIKFILSNEFSYAQKFMEQAVIQTSSNLRGRILNSLNEMKMLSEKLNNFTDTYTDSEIIKFLTSHIDDYDYQRLIYIKNDGKHISYSKLTKQISYASYINEEDINRVYKGESIFTQIKQDSHSPSSYINEFIVPVYNKQNTKIVGILASRIYADKFAQILIYY